MVPGFFGAKELDYMIKSCFIRNVFRVQLVILEKAKITPDFYYAVTLFRCIGVRLCDLFRF